MKSLLIYNLSVTLFTIFTQGVVYSRTRKTDWLLILSVRWSLSVTMLVVLSYLANV